MTRLNLLFISSLLLIGLVAGCAPSASPATGTAAAPGQTRFVNSTLGLRIYPGSTVLHQEERGRTSQTEFETPANVTQVYDFFHGQLENSGWQRTSYTEHSQQPMSEARYIRTGQEIRLRLSEQGSGRYRLEISGR